MAIYKAGDKWILGTEGNGDMTSFPEAIILSTKPILTKRWKTPSETIPNSKDKCKYDYTFWEYQADGRNIYIYKIERTERYIYSLSECFITKDHFEKMIDFHRNGKGIAVYNWIETNEVTGEGYWDEIERTFKTDEDEEEDDVFDSPKSLLH